MEPIDEKELQLAVVNNKPLLYKREEEHRDNVRAAAEP